MQKAKDNSRPCFRRDAKPYVFIIFRNNSLWILIEFLLHNMYIDWTSRSYPAVYWGQYYN